MTLCTHMSNILRFGGWLNFANEHVEYNNRYKITNVHYYGELTSSCEIAYFKVRNFQFFVTHHIFQWLSNQSFLLWLLPTPLAAIFIQNMLSTEG